MIPLAIRFKSTAVSVLGSRNFLKMNTFGLRC